MPPPHSSCCGPVVKILGIDIGVNLGWAVGSTDAGARLFCGTQRLGPAGADHGFYASTSMTFLIDLIQANKPDLVAYEFSQATIAAKQDKRVTTIDVILVHCGLRWMILGVANGMQVRTREFTPQATLKTFCRGQKVEKGERKKAIKRECYIRGIDYGTEHAADAVALWHHAACTVDPDFAARDAVARMRIKDPLAGGVML